MSIPGNGLQTVFAQQAAAAVDETHERQLRGTVRTVLGATALIWLLSVGVILGFRQQIIAGLGISNPSALTITLVAGLPIIWSPILGGLLQGRQNFLWLGWTGILAGWSPQRSSCSREQRPTIVEDTFCRDRHRCAVGTR